MKEGPIKTKIFLIGAIDILLVIAVFAFGIYSVLYSEHQILMALAALVGLFFVNVLGNFGNKKVVHLRKQLEEIRRENRRTGRTI